MSGDARYHSLMNKSLVEIEYSGPLYMVIVLKPEQESSDDEPDTVAELVERCSGGGVTCHFSQAPASSCFAVVVNLPDEGSADDALSRVKAAVEERFDFQVGVSRVFGDITALPEAYNDAMAQCARTPPLLWFAEASAEGVLSAVLRKDTKAAAAHFKSFFEEAARNSKSFAYEKMAYCRLLGNLCTLAEENSLIVDQELTDMIVMALDRNELKKRFLSLLRSLCEGAEAASGDAPDGRSRYRANEVLKYIIENYADKDLSLDKLSGVFSLSNRYISNMIREATGLSYMEFLTGIRIKKTCELLLADKHNVTEVCYAAGYMHLPHFTKTFKRVTGYTPSMFYSERRKTR